MKQQGRASEFKKKRTDVDHGPFKGTQLEFIIDLIEKRKIPQNQDLVIHKSA